MPLKLRRCCSTFYYKLYSSKNGCRKQTVLRASGWIDWTFLPPLLRKGEVSYIMKVDDRAVRWGSDEDDKKSLKNTLSLNLTDAARPIFVLNTLTSLIAVVTFSVFTDLRHAWLSERGHAEPYLSHYQAVCALCAKLLSPFPPWLFVCSGTQFHFFR